MKLGTVYITVGTTKFDILIQTITSDKVLQILKSRGCTKLILQLGSGQPVNTVQRIRDTYGIDVEQYEFKLESVRSDILNSDIIIGHAGAGTCMDILSNKKPGLAVVNSDLMNNHQTELAKQLAHDGYLYYCTVDGLAEQLETFDFNALKPYVEDKQAMQKFLKHLNTMMTAN